MTAEIDISNDKLADALRDATFVAEMLDAICETDGTVDRMKARDAAFRVRDALQAHDAEAAQPPAQNAKDAARLSANELKFYRISLSVVV